MCAYANNIIARVKTCITAFHHDTALRPLMESNEKQVKTLRLHKDVFVEDKLLSIKAENNIQI
jgi:hypothetical protein